LRSLEQIVPLVLLIHFARDADVVYGGPCEIMKRFLREPRLNPLIASVQLGPSLLQQQHPQRTINSLRERRRTALDRNVLIQIDGHPLALVQHLD